MLKHIKTQLNTLEKGTWNDLNITNSIQEILPNALVEKINILINLSSIQLSKIGTGKFL